MTSHEEKESAFEYLLSQIKRAWLTDNPQAFIFNIGLLTQLWNKEESSGNNSYLEQGGVEWK